MPFRMLPCHRAFPGCSKPIVAADDGSQSQPGRAHAKSGAARSRMRASHRARIRATRWLIRATGPPVIASASEAIHRAAKGKLDCFVASLLAMTARQESAIPRRDAPGFCRNPSPRTEGAGNAGRPMRPIAACAMVVVERTRVSQVTPESPGIPHAMVLTVSFALSPVTGLSCHRRPREACFSRT